MRGRSLVLGITVFLAGLFSPVAAEAQQAAKVARIGYPFLDRAASPHLYEAFRQGLRELGYVEGRSVVIEYRDAEGEINRLPALAAELAALKADVIVAGGPPHALAAKQATAVIPIVFMAVPDPVGNGLIASLARPGGNLTGLSSVQHDLVGKRLEQLNQVVPRVRKVAVLRHPTEHRLREAKEAELAGKTLGLRLQFVEARGRADFERVFSEMTKAGVGALTVLASSTFFNERSGLADVAARNRLPTMYVSRDFVEAGGLISYGPNLADSWRRAATYVDKILKGAKPADLPVEQPTKFELVINLKAAKALGLTIPQSILLRADHVIE